MKKQIQFYQYNLLGSATVKKKARQKLLTQEQVEKLFQKHVTAIRKIRGFVNVNIKTTIRVADATNPDRAVVLESRHAV